MAVQENLLAAIETILAASDAPGVSSRQVQAQLGLYSTSYIGMALRALAAGGRAHSILIEQPIQKRLYRRAEVAQ